MEKFNITDSKITRELDKLFKYSLNIFSSSPDT